MRLRSDRDRWGGVMKTLHWLMVLLIVGLATVGWYMKGMPNSPDKIGVYALHKSLGLTVLALAVLRLWWRTFVDRERPPLPPHMPAWQRFGAHASHVGLYALLFAIPLSGWLFNSAANFPLRWFGLFSVPSLSGPDPALKAFAGAAHWALFWVLCAVLAAHVGAALWHHFVARDEVLRRMWPGTRARGSLDTRDEPVDVPKETP
jgi:cytochrome b561